MKSLKLSKKPSIGILVLTAVASSLGSANLWGENKLPQTPQYLGEIKRGADGRLISTPENPPPTQEPKTTNAIEPSHPDPKPTTQKIDKSSKTSSPKEQEEANTRPSTLPQIIRVGTNQRIKTIEVATKFARNGDTVEIETGDYIGDVAIWTQDNLTIKGIGGPVRLIANGRNVEGKGIWIMRGGKITVENIEFSGAKVADRNGAGIRFEKGHLIVRNCLFHNNQNGILTHSDKDAELDIQNSEFHHNGYGDGESHNLYVGRIKRFQMTGSYSHHGIVGQLLKSRAAENKILYNRLTDESGGRASYEIDLPNGGIAYVIGNIIQQSATTENSHMISFGVEGYAWEKNELYLINNTLVDDRPANGVFLLLKPGPAKILAINNLAVGGGSLNPAEQKKGTLETLKTLLKPGSYGQPPEGSYLNNYSASWNDFTQASRYNYKLIENSKYIAKTIDAGTANGFSLKQKRQYQHPRNSIVLKNNKLLNPGAEQ